jgi:hypothetical protein
VIMVHGFYLTITRVIADIILRTTSYYEALSGAYES